MNASTTTIPSWVGIYAERVIAARGHAARLKRVVERSPVPMMMVDRERRYVEANGPARLAFRLSLAELRRLRVDDLTSPSELRVMTLAWERLIETGWLAGRREVAAPDGGRLEVSYYALANALPGLHLGAFSPADWPEGELLREFDAIGPRSTPALTPRELEVLELAAEGLNGPMIARELVLSAATVRTHFGHIYAKLAVPDRAAAVARAMRLGLIA